MITIGCQKGREELAGIIATLQLLLFQNPTPMHVNTASSLSPGGKSACWPRAHQAWFVCSSSFLSQPLQLHLVSLEGTVA